MSFDDFKALWGIGHSTNCYCKLFAVSRCASDVDCFYLVSDLIAYLSIGRDIVSILHLGW